MTTFATYQSSLTAAVAREHVHDLLRAADQSRATALLRAHNPHRTPRRRRMWWQWTTVRSATSSTPNPG
jgi:hypothetical protein